MSRLAAFVLSSHPPHQSPRDVRRPAGGRPGRRRLSGVRHPHSCRRRVSGRRPARRAGSRHSRLRPGRALRRLGAQGRRLRTRGRRRHVLPAGAVHRKHADGVVDAPHHQRRHDRRALARRRHGRVERRAADRRGHRAGGLCRLRRDGAGLRLRRLRRPRRHGEDRRDPVERAVEAAQRAAGALRVDRAQAEERRRPRRRRRRHGPWPRRHASAFPGIR